MRPRFILGCCLIVSTVAFVGGCSGGGGEEQTSQYMKQLPPGGKIPGKSAMKMGGAGTAGAGSGASAQ